MPGSSSRGPIEAAGLGRCRAAAQRDHAEAGAKRSGYCCREAGAGGARIRRLHAAGGIAHRRNESRRTADPAAPVGGGGAGAADRVRERRGAAAGARSAAAAGIRGAQRAGDQPRCAVPAGVHGEPGAGALGRCVGHRPGVRNREGVQADRRARHPPPGCGDDGLAGAGVRTRRSRWGSGVGRDLSGASRFEPRPGAGAEERRSEEQRGTRGAAAASRGHDRADGADAGTAGGRGTADPHHEQPGESAVRLQHRPRADDERHGAAGQVGRLPPPRARTGVGAARSAIRSLRMGRAADGQQLARRSRDRRTARAGQARATGSPCRCGR